MKPERAPVVVITGAAAGIGREVARLYGERGALVVAIDRDPSALADFEGPSIVADVAEKGALASAARRVVAEHGKPAVWINNAGVTLLGAFSDVSPERFQSVIDVNLGGVIEGTRAAMSVMVEPVRGTIVNIASIAGIVPAPFMSAYVASKHAVVGFTRSLRQELELAHSPLKVILVAPGFVRTQIMAPQGGFEFPEHLNFLVGKPEGVAREIVEGIEAGQAEIHPTASGKLFVQLNRIMPDLLRRSSRLLVARDWKELLGFTRIGRR